LILAAVSIAAFIAGPLIAFLGISSPLIGFYTFGLGGLLGIVTLLVSLVAAFRGGIGAAAVGLGLGGVVTLVFLLLAVPARSFPPINDITTDTATPPQFVQATSLPDNAGRDMTYPGEHFAQQQIAGYPDLRGLRLDQSPQEVFERVIQTAREMPLWEITRTDSSAFALEGFATSRLFHFRDDFVIEVRPAEGGSVVHMRSKSRDGRGDVGANAARIKGFFAKLSG
jgi:uncharacterized protein (DUF1499 family)